MLKERAAASRLSAWVARYSLCDECAMVALKVLTRCYDGLLSTPIRSVKQLAADRRLCEATTSSREQVNNELPSPRHSGRRCGRFVERIQRSSTTRHSCYASRSSLSVKRSLLMVSRQTTKMNICHKLSVYRRPQGRKLRSL